MASSKKLQVKNLQISFRTQAGILKAVRNISFDLYSGETLAIVGESGSGKSVTSKAIIGILAGNSIVEGGEILYDGKELLKIDEENFHKIRGDKIAMIFQDPLSSLNPIMRVGKQLNEAMILNGKARQKNARIEFNSHLKLLQQNLDEVNGDKEGNKKICKTFNDFSIVATQLEKVYNERVKEFFLKHNIRKREDLAKLIAKGPEFYPPLEGYGEILNGIKDLRVVNCIIIPSIEEKGIGNIEEKRKKIVESIIENPNSADLARLTEEEIKEVESSIGEEIETAVSEADDKKETIVGRIISLAARRDAIKKEIERRSKGNNTHNTKE